MRDSFVVSTAPSSCCGWNTVTAPMVRACVVLVSLVALSMIAARALAHDASFSMYKLNYFGFSSEECSTGGWDAAFQISVKHRLGGAHFPDPVPLVGGRANPFHFVYTQRSFNDLCVDSEPFRETNYLPGLIAVSRDDKRAGFTQREWSSGWEHESNGLGGEASRAWNRLFIESQWGYNRAEDIDGETGRGSFADYDFVTLRLRLWHILQGAEGSEENEIRDFQGDFEFETILTGVSRQLGLTLRKGRKADETSVTLELTLKKLPLLGDLVPSLFDLDTRQLGFFFRYFNGYGDELIEFDQKQEVFRVGLRFLQ